MAWDSVPWFTEGGAEHSSELARLLAYAAFGGAEGVVGARDLQVRALSSPAASVQIRTGACAITNRAAGAAYQSYAARLPVAEQIPIAATGATARSDLVVARIENPYSYGETWPNPPDPKVGPYVFTRVISGVPKTTTHVGQVRSSDSAIALARIDIPANTASITQTMIKDLREMVSPRRRRVVRHLHGVWDTPDEVGNIKEPNWEMFPNGARWDIEIPEWATQLFVQATWAQLDQRNPYHAYGYLRVRVGSRATKSTRYNCDWVGSPQRHTFVGGGRLYIPASMRGTVQTVTMEGSGRKGDKGVLEVDGGSVVFTDLEFVEAPDEDES
ncbi:hypothetical protein U9R90_26665 [Streptomyces sp. E11-3]|uniref:hypothetical protein n=1 Tax=Streptomyces sp. E11-3 TaxID=3110112 RepID=UPI00397FE526